MHPHFQVGEGIPELVVGIRMQVLLLIWQEESSLVLQLLCRYLTRCIACQVNYTLAVVEHKMEFVVANNEGPDLYVLVNIEVRREGAEVLFRCGNHFSPRMDEALCHKQLGQDQPWVQSPLEPVDKILAP